MSFVIAVDGPAASGKGTVAQRLAERRGAERITWFQIVGEAVVGQRWRHAAEGWRLDNNLQEQA